MLGTASHDLDFVVSDRAVRLAFEVADSLGVPAYVLDRDRDTGRVILPDQKTTLDFARFRGDDLDADLRMRDFTINAMALPITADDLSGIIDPCGGSVDLVAKVVRQTHDQAVTNDPVRALRAVRFAKSLGFAMSADTAAAATEAGGKLNEVSPERIRDELLNLLQTAVPGEAFAQLYTLGLLAIILPEVAALEDVTQSYPHDRPVLAHTLAVMDWLIKVEAAINPGEMPLPSSELEPVCSSLAAYAHLLNDHLEQRFDGDLEGRTLLRLAALLHDAGKKVTQTVEEGGRIRFFDHDTVGAQLARSRLRALCLSNQAIAHVSNIIAGHMRPLHLVQSMAGRTNFSVSRRAVYRFFRDTRSAGIEIVLLALADHLATFDGPGDETRWQRLVKLVGTLCHHYFERHTETVAPVPLLDGRQLMDALQLSPGPEIGRLLRLIEEAQAAGKVSTREEALRLARQSR